MIACTDCRHRTGVGFRDLSGPELSLMRRIKHSHKVAPAHDVLIEEGQAQPLLFTLYSGTASCTVQAVTDVTYCQFDTDKWRSELMHAPALANRLCERLLIDQRHLEDRLTAISACTAEGAIAHFLISLYDRLRARRLCREGTFALPLTNRQIADAVGMTTVHLHRVLRKLKDAAILTHDNHRVVLHDEAKLREIACLPAERGDRPLL